MAHFPSCKQSTIPLSLGETSAKPHSIMAACSNSGTSAQWSLHQLQIVFLTPRLMNQRDKVTYGTQNLVVKRGRATAGLTAVFCVEKRHRDRNLGSWMEKL